MLMQRCRLRGLGLVELLISIVIGLFFLAGLSAFLGRSLSAAGKGFQDSRLSQELNATLELMARDVRRAGYSSTAQDTLPANPFTQDAVPAANDGGISLASAGCILYAYDMPDTANGARDLVERLGFKLQSDAVYAGTQATDCTTGSWQPLTDPKVSKITDLSFEYLDGTGNLAAPQSPILSASGTNWAACTRLIRVTIRGHLVGNPSGARTLSQSVRVRNDWYRTGASTC